MLLARDLVAISFAGVRLNSARSLLTILGIVIGVTAIIVVMSIGQGAEDLIVRQMSGLGSRTLLIGAGREPKGPSDLFEFLTTTLKEREFEALADRTKVPTLTAVSPAIFETQSAEYGGETARGTLLGASESVFPIFEVFPAEGRAFGETEVRDRSSVVVLGSDLKDKLFGPSEAVDARIRIKGKAFRVIGVLAPKGNVAIFNADEFMVIPYTTMQHYLLGQKNYHRIIAQAENEASVPLAVRDVQETLRELHNITDPSKDDFFIDTQADAAKRVGIVASIFTAFMVTVAAISLIVGGIGIMNIMLVSVTERIREIGTRKALGARRRDIMKQFLFEAVILTLSGGIIGILLGAAISYAASWFLSKFVLLNWQFIFPVSAVVVGVGISGLTGLIFGIYPAMQASEKDPIDALRFE